MAKPVRHSWPTPTWTRSPSPAQPKSAASSVQATAGSGKKLSLELGGKSPFIVYEDADLDAAVEGVVDAVWFNQGQVCCAGTRLLVQEGVRRTLPRQAEDSAWRHCASAIRSTSRPTWGRLSIRFSLQRVTALVKKGEERRRHPGAGAVCLASQGQLTSRHRCSLTSIPSSTVMQEEIFGPVVSAMTFRTPDEAASTGQSHALWSCRLHLVREHQRGSRCARRA